MTRRKITTAPTTEPILVRNRVVQAELLYTSQRGDYKLYLYRGRTYRVMTDGE